MTLQMSAAEACLGRLLPDKSLERYKNVFIGQVVGIELVEYKEKRIKELRGEDNLSYSVGVTMDYIVKVLPERLRKGTANEVEMLKIGGCGVPIPVVPQVGIFFVEPDGTADVIYNDQSFNYEDYVEAAWDYYKQKRERLKINRGNDANNLVKPNPSGSAY